MIILGRKVISVGNSAAIIIPPEALHSMGVSIGDLLGWDLSAPGFGVLCKIQAPPIVTHPELFDPEPPA